MRNDFLLFSLILPLISCNPNENEQAKSTTLEEAYEGAFLIGTALNETIVSGQDKTSQHFVLQQFNTIDLLMNL